MLEVELARQAFKTRSGEEPDYDNDREKRAGKASIEDLYPPVQRHHTPRSNQLEDF
jgi:hypothetical protein